MVENHFKEVESVRSGQLFHVPRASFPLPRELGGLLSCDICSQMHGIRLRKTGHCVEEQIKKVGFIQQYLQVFVNTAPRPGDEPRGNVLRLFKKASLSSTNGDSGTKLWTCSGNSR